MRVSQDIPQRPRGRRKGVWLLAALAVLILLVIVVQGVAGFYTNFLWYHWNGLGAIWRSVTATKVGIAAVFVVIAFGTDTIYVFVAAALATTIRLRSRWHPYGRFVSAATFMGLGVYAALASPRMVK